MTYADGMRGKIMNPDRKRQLFDFSGLRRGKCTGSDMDYMMEIDDFYYAFVEFKYGHRDMPYGQKIALKRLTNIVCSTGRESILLLAQHFEPDPNVTVDAAETIVDEYFYRNRWYNGDGKTTKEVLDAFFDHGNEKYRAFLQDKSICTQLDLPNE